MALGMEGNDGEVRQVQGQRQGEGEVDGWMGNIPVPSLLWDGSGLLDATPTPSPAAIPTPTVLVQEPAEAQAGGQTGTGNVPVASDGSHRLALSRSVENIIAAFLAGYRAGGGDPAWEPRVLAMVRCESSWRLDPPGPHLGPAQFSVDTWEKAKCSADADYRDPWEQGCAVANWMAQIPGLWGTTAGWPNCW